MSNEPRGTRRALFPSGVSRPVASPIQASVVYASPDPDTLDAQYGGGASGYTYAREGHPNADVLTGLLNAAENASGGLVVGSGMAAVSVALMANVKAGDHILGADQLYGRSLRLMAEDLPRFGIETSLADPTDIGAFERALRPNTRLILIETTSNPTLRVADVEGIIALAKARQILVVVDNTFATPRGLQPLSIGADIVVHSVTKLLAGHSDATLGYVGTDVEGIIALAKSRQILVVVDNTFATPRGLQPLSLGADIVVHSVTKLLAGHSDATLGYVGTDDAACLERMSVLSQTLGLTASPFDCWLAERGLYSFDLRYDKATQNAALLADALAEMPGVTKVIYPTRRDHPDHNRAMGLLGGEGGHMISFEVKPTRAAANALVRAADGIAFAPTLGDIGTTLSHPVTSSHRAVPEADRLAIGISEGFFRVSVGCEDAGALIDAFRKAVAAADAA